MERWRERWSDGWWRNRKEWRSGRRGDMVDMEELEGMEGGEGKEWWEESTGMWRRDEEVEMKKEWRRYKGCGEGME